MKKEILEALKAKFEGVSDSILGRIADKLAKTAATPEQVKTSVEGVTIQQVIESYGDSRATEASDTARKNAVQDYETRHGLKDGKPVTTTTAGGDPPKDTTATDTTTNGDSETAKLLKQLADRLDKMETARATETRKQQLEKAISKLPDTLRKAYERTPLDGTDETFAATLADIEKEVAGINDTMSAKGGIFGRPTKSTNNPTTELTEAQKAAITKREGIPAKDGQPF